MNRKFIKGVLISLILIVLFTISAFATEIIFEGKGTDESPYLIQNSDDIETLAELVNSGDEAYISSFYKLTDDVSLAGINHTPIGTSEYPFSGSFDGGLYIIKDLYINSSEQYLGFFGVTENAELNNIVIENADITSTSEDILFAGILAGSMIVADVEDCFYVSKCSVQGNVTATSQKNAYAAGVTAKCNVKNGLLIFLDCHITASISAEGSGSTYCGGVIGNMSATNSGFVSVMNCIVEGSVSAESKNLHSYAGGVTAFANQQEKNWTDFVPLPQTSDNVNLMADTTVYSFNTCVVDCEIESTAANIVNVSNLAAHVSEFVEVGTNYTSSEKTINASANSSSCNIAISSETLLSKEYLLNTVGLDFTDTWTVVFDEVKLRTVTPYILSELDELRKVVKAQPVGCSAGKLVVAIYSEKNRIHSVKFVPCFANVQETLEIPLSVSDFYAIKVFMISSTNLGPLCDFVEL